MMRKSIVTILCTAMVGWGTALASQMIIVWAPQPFDTLFTTRTTTVAGSILDARVAFVMVNDAPSFTNPEQGWFYTNDVEIISGMTRIQVKAFDAAGLLLENIMVPITVDPGSVPRLVATPFSGLTALTVHLTFVQGDFSEELTFQRYQADFDGDGTVDLDTPDPARLTYDYQLGGLYIPFITVTDAKATPLFYDFTAVEVLPPSYLPVVYAPWDRMRAAFIRGDRAGALAQIHPYAYESYDEVFTELDAQLPRLGAEMPVGSRLIFISLIENEAVFLAEREEQFDMGPPVTVSYPVTFQKIVIPPDNGNGGTGWCIYGF